MTFQLFTLANIPHEHYKPIGKWDAEIRSTRRRHTKSRRFPFQSEESTAEDRFAFINDSELEIKCKSLQNHNTTKSSVKAERIFTKYLQAKKT